MEWVAGCLRDLNCDVAFLNEVHRRHLPTIQRIAGMRAIFGTARRVGVRRFGNAILARTQPTQRRVVALSGSPGLERRSVVIGRMADGLHVAATHLGLTAGERATHVRELLAEIGDRSPMVLAGDFNASHDAPELSGLMFGFTDACAQSANALTFPSGNPDRRIDYVFLRNLRVVACEAPPLQASDHRPVVVDLDTA